ncbi:YraN family protein [Helicovermis profundi]|uniref:UPF0102 protein HLPR_17220 n=1 Tax=Helicovermis profundi TaxID=3065157 RepID=A0AAU9EPV6_9FIRM|nr:YraN family protein [Clostridia bacterium S502]
MNKIELGKLGENIAEEYLKSVGHFIINRNFFNRLGEIDIISRSGNELFLVEVKTRRSLEYGHPLEFINRKKIDRIIKCYNYHQIKKKIINPCYFVSGIGIIVDVNGEINIEYIEKIIEWV